MWPTHEGVDNQRFIQKRKGVFFLLSSDQRERIRRKKTVQLLFVQNTLTVHKQNRLRVHQHK